jgi:hypothetical protein
LRNIIVRYLSTPSHDALGVPSPLRASLEPAILTVLGLGPAEAAAVLQRGGGGASPMTARGSPAAAAVAVGSLAVQQQPETSAGAVVVGAGRPHQLATPSPGRAPQTSPSYASYGGALRGGGGGGGDLATAPGEISLASIWSALSGQAVA